MSTAEMALLQLTDAQVHMPGALRSARFNPKYTAKLNNAVTLQNSSQHPLPLRLQAELCDA